MDPTSEFEATFARPERPDDLERLALLIAAQVRPSLDVEGTLGSIERLADRVPARDLGSLRRILFEELRFTGNTGSYYDPENSMLDSVISRRVGIPITLSVLTIAVARRADIDLLGVGLPGHFLVRPAGDAGCFLDPFAGGAVLDLEDCAELIRRTQGDHARLLPEHLAPVGTALIIERMLNNLLAIYRSQGDRRGRLWVARLRTMLPQATTIHQTDLAAALGESGRFDAAALLLDELAAEADPETARSLTVARDRMRSLMN